MDFNLPALKLFIRELKMASPPAPSISSAGSTPSVMALGNLHFQRAWLQGVLVPGCEHEGNLLLDDGSGVIELYFSKESQTHQWKAGMYVLIVGAYTVKDGTSVLKVHKIVDLSSSPDREAMWNMEVIEAHDLFYAASIG
ncbi:hypothetical protein KP509_19G068500 [Ceratopteris richardii]|uniref:RecQ-mediated genome instability protein 2 n=1 Tax=Ceratopteris richardii TaxID=49495 RepID=A0A8T2SQE9_CERRI|nr:hypothetical protein KP509_19G068500 [Ceratopteris richardii]